MPKDSNSKNDDGFIQINQDVQPLYKSNPDELFDAEIKHPDNQSVISKIEPKGVAHPEIPLEVTNDQPPKQDDTELLKQHQTVQKNLIAEQEKELEAAKTEIQFLKKVDLNWIEKYTALQQEIESLRQAALQKPIAVETMFGLKEYVIHHKVFNAQIQLPNATEGKAYHFVLNMSKFGLTEIIPVELAGLETCGLCFDPITNQIQGIPTQSGDISIQLRYHLLNQTTLWGKSISFFVNKDPRSLWKNIPSDPTAPYPKSDSDHFQLATSGKMMVAASQRGRSHAQVGSFRDDDFMLTHHETSKWNLIVVADGAGAAKFSRQGSFISCQTITDYFNAVSKKQVQDIEDAIEGVYVEPEKRGPALKNLLYTHLAGAAHKAFKAIEKEALTNQSKSKDYATTLMFSILKKFEFGWFIASFGVGDSPMCIYTKGAKPIIMHYPEEGEYSGQTYFLTMPEIFKDSMKILNRIQFRIIPDFTALLLMTDGIYDPKFETHGGLNNPQKWDDLWNELTQSFNFSHQNESLSSDLLKWMDFWSPGNHDDRTLAILF
jgi:Protein phosphatase 2C